MGTGEEDRPGSLLAGRFRLERVVGRGASAIVWEATHVVTGQTVALKVFGREAGLGGDGKRRDRLLREARAASRSRHPHVLAIDDLLDLDDGRAALVMPLLSGESLRARLARDGKLTVETVRALFAPAIEGLARAHEAGIVHRDLKPDNLFVAGDPPRLVILDFGVAKIAADGELGLTSTGVTVGTPFYMAPEQLFGEDDVDARADVWALGVVLVECLTGARPTEASNLGQLLKKISAGAITRLAPDDAPDAPELVAVVGAMLSVERDDRPTLAAVRAALLVPATAPQPAAPPPVSSPPPSPPSTRTARPKAGVPWLGITGAALLALTLLATADWLPIRASSTTTRAAVGSAPVAVPSASFAETASPPPPAAPDVQANLGILPSSTSAVRVAPSVVSAGTVRPLASSAKMVAAPPPPAVSSPSPPPRIVEQAPF